MGASTAGWRLARPGDTPGQLEPEAAVGDG